MIKFFADTLEEKDQFKGKFLIAEFFLDEKKEWYGEEIDVMVADTLEEAEDEFEEKKENLEKSCDPDECWMITISQITNGRYDELRKSEESIMKYLLRIQKLKEYTSPSYHKNPDNIYGKYKDAIDLCTK